MGGDISGTTGNATVSKLDGYIISVSNPSTNQILAFNGTAWVPINPPSTTPSGSAGGDLHGTYPNPTVAKLQGNAVSQASPVGGFVLTWDSVDGYWVSTRTFAFETQ